MSATSTRSLDLRGASTRSGRATASSSAIRPPRETPTSAARWMPRSSSSPIRSRASDHDPGGSGERPWPRWSQRMVRCVRGNVTHCGPACGCRGYRRGAGPPLVPLPPPGDTAAWACMGRSPAAPMRQVERGFRGRDQGSRPGRYRDRTGDGDPPRAQPAASRVGAGRVEWMSATPSPGLADPPRLRRCIAGSPRPQCRPNSPTGTASKAGATVASV